MTGSKFLPHLRCSCSNGRPRVSTMCVSPQCTIAIVIGWRSSPFWVRMYSCRWATPDAAQHALPDQFLQPLREQMASDPKRGLKSFEAARAQEAFAQDKKGP